MPPPSPAAPPVPAPPGPARRAAAELALLGALALVGALAGTLCCAWAGFAAGKPVSPLDLAGGGLLSAALALVVGRRRGGRAGLARATLALVGCAILCAAALRLAPLRHDVSWDGQSYHQQAVLALAAGWNPLGPPLPAERFTAHAYADNMAKGTWILEAAAYRLTGRIEAAKAVNLVWLAAAFLAALAALLSTASLPALAALAGALLAALDPVAFTQLFTFYVDGTLASAFLATAAFAWLAVARADRAALLGASLATLLLANAKLTGVPYAVLLWAAAAAAAWLRGGRREAARLGAVAAGALALATVGLGWNPYVTNTLRFGHPFHPAAGAHATDFVRDSRPAELEDANRLVRLARSTFAVTSNQIELGVRAKPPFAVRWEEWAATSGCDVRIAGLGPLFGGALLLSLLAVSLARRPAARASILAALAILVTVLATAEGWWARLAPQLWLAPIVLAAAPLAAPRRRTARLAGAAVLLALSVNAGLVVVNNLNRVGRTERELRRQLSELSARGAPVEVQLRQFESAGVRLSEAGIAWRASDDLRCPRPEPLAGSFRVELCRTESSRAP